MARGALAEFEQARAPVFAALGDATRLRIVARLGSGGSSSIAALSTHESMTRQAVTKHLRVLEQVGLIEGSKHGREQLWKLRAERLEEARDWLDEISSQWDAALEKLRMFVEEPPDGEPRKAKDQAP